MLRPRLALFFASLLLLGAGLARAADKWLELKTPNFTIVSNAGEKDTRQIAAELEQIRAILSQAIDSPGGDGAPVTVLVLESEKALQELLVPSGKTVWDWDLVAIAASTPESYFLALKPLHPIGARTSDIYTPTTLPITPLTFQIYAGRFVRLSYGLLPLWLDAGLKQFYGSTVFMTGEIRVGALNPHRQESVYVQKMIPMEELLTATRETTMDFKRAEQFKNQAGALVHYLTFGEDHPKRRPIREIMELIRHGSDSIEAVQKTAGDLKQLQRKLQRYLRRDEFLQARVAAPAPLNVKDLPFREVPRAELSALLGTFMQSNWWEVYLHEREDPRPLTERVKIIQEATHKMKHAGKPAVSLSSQEFIAFSRESDLQDQRMARARGYFEEAARLDPGLPPVQIGIGWRHYLDGNLAGARDWLQKAVTAHPDNYLAHYRLALTFADAPADPETVARATNGFRRAIALQPRFAPAYHQLAKMMLLAGNVEEATRLAHRALQLDLSNPAYFVAISRLLLRSSQPDLARLAARQAVAGTENSAELQEAKKLLAEAVAQLASQPASQQGAAKPPQQ